MYGVREVKGVVPIDLPGDRVGVAEFKIDHEGKIYLEFVSNGLAKELTHAVMNYDSVQLSLHYGYVPGKPKETDV